MGLFSSIKKAAKKAIKVAAPIAIGAGAAQFTGPPAIAAGLPTILRGLPNILKGLPIPGRLPPTIPPIPRLPRGGGGLPRGGFPRLPPILPIPGLDFGGGATGGCPAGFHLAKDGSGRCVRNRRMNVMNPRAAKRAIRRIKGARKMLQQIERQLPKQRVRSAPRGHRARLTHE